MLFFWDTLYINHLNYGRSLKTIGKSIGQEEYDTEHGQKIRSLAYSIQIYIVSKTIPKDIFYLVEFFYIIYVHDDIPFNLNGF